MVENEVDIEVVTVQRDAFLPGDEGETFAEFEEKGLQVINESLLKAGFYQPWRFRQAEEFDHDRVFEDIYRLLDLLPFRRQPQQSFLVFAQRESFIEQAVDLPFKFTSGPVVLDGLNLIKRTSPSVIHTEQP